MTKVFTGFWMAVLILVPSVWALDVTGGLADHQVVQCNEDEVADLVLSGVGTESGTLEARVIGVQKTVIDWISLGESSPMWSVTIPQVPVGGPYRIELRVFADGKPVSNTSVHDVLVGDVWVLAGQSNMQGVGDRHDEETSHPLVHTYAMSYEWRLAQEPLHTLAESPDSVHFNPNKTAEERDKAIRNWRGGTKGSGLGLSFAKEMVKRTGRPIGLIASAHGGTSMDQWDPGKKDQGGASLYGSMCKQVDAAGGKVCGVLWYQGESDANADASPVFQGKLEALIAAMRKDFGNPDLPFFHVQIGRVVLPWDETSWNRVQTNQLATEGTVKNSAVVAAIDLSIDDAIHISTPGLKVLGHRLANLAEAHYFDGETLAGPRLESAKRYGNLLKLKFSGINGSLLSQGRPSGFSISAGPDGEDVLCIFKIEFKDDKPNELSLFLNGRVPENPHLWYGRGVDPYCTIVDEANMALPVFGPLAIK